MSATQDFPQLDRRYRLGQRLGEGASGVVYQGHDEVTGAAVAIKRYAKGVDPWMLRQRFWQWARLSHPNLVSLLDVGRDDEGAVLVVMALAEGRDLAEVARARRPSSDEATSILRDAARGLAHLHAHGLVHGDVKAANCVLTTVGLQLVDGGDDVLGELAHARPLRLHGAAPDPADDLYALGMMAARLLVDFPVSAVGGSHDLLGQLHAAGTVPGALRQVLAALLAGSLVTADALLARLDAEVGEAVGHPLGLNSAVPLVGRAEELRVVRAVEQSCLVVGHAGVGKSRLVREAWRGLPGPVPAIGACQAGAGAGLQVWREVFGGLATRGAVPTSPEVVAWLDSGVAPAKLALFEALARWLGGADAPRILIEDLHWADQASVELFAFLAAQGVPIVGTSRPCDAVVSLRQHGSLAVVDLRDLDGPEAAALLSACLGTIPPAHPFLHWSYALTGGNPLHLCELATHLQADGGVTYEGGVVRLPDELPLGSPGLAGLIQALAAALSDDARALLKWGVVLDNVVQLAFLAELTEWPAERLFEAVAELGRARFWRPRRDGFAFRHDRLREALASFWPPEELASAHLLVARKLESTSAAPATLAFHFDRAGQRPEAFAHLMAAGDLASAQGSMGDAITAWKRALELLDEIEGVSDFAAHPERVSQQRFELWERVAPASVTVEPVIGEALLPCLTLRLEQEAPLERHLAEIGRDLAGATLAEVLAPIVLGAPGQAAPSGWPRLLVRIHIHAALEAMCEILAKRPEAAEAGLARADALLPWPNHWLSGVIAIPRCTAGAWWERFGDVADLAATAEARLSEAPAALQPLLAPFRLLAKIYMVHAASFLDAHLPEELFERALAEARAMGRADMTAVLCAVPVRVIGVSGSWPAFKERQRTFERSLERSGLMLTAMVEGYLCRLSGMVQQGDWAGVSADADAFPSQLLGTTYVVWHGAQVAQALVCLNRLEEADALLQRAEEATACRGFGFSLARAMLAVARGDAEAAVLVETALDRSAAPISYNVVDLVASLRLRAVLATRRGDLARARQDLDEALELAARYKNPLQAAITWLWIGRLSDTDAGRAEALAEATRRFEALENPHYLALIEREQGQRWWVMSTGEATPGPQSDSVDSALTSIVAWAMEAAHADRGKLLLLGPGGELATRVSLNRDGLTSVASHSSAVVRHVLDTGRGLWVADVSNDPRFQDGLSLKALDLRTVICVPMRWGDRPQGLLYLDRREASAPFTRDDFREVEVLAGYGALVLTYAEVAEREQRQRELAEVLLAVAVAARGADPGQLRTELALKASKALGGVHVEVTSGPRPLTVTWPSEPDADQAALAAGLDQLAAVALERADLLVRESEQRLRATVAEELARERKALIQQLVHDLRSPLQTIALLNMGLAARASDGSEISGAVNVIEQQVAFMAKFLEQKLDKLAGQPTAEWTELAALLCDVEARFAPRCRAKAIALKVDRGMDARLAIADVEAAQILGNLLDNAVKFTPSGGRVAMEVQIADGWATFAVCDSGPGFRSGPLEASGHGLGLAHARQLASDAGGWLVVDEAIAVGARVWVGLPTDGWGKQANHLVDF